MSEEVDTILCSVVLTWTQFKDVISRAPDETEIDNNHNKEAAVSTCVTVLCPGELNLESCLTCSGFLETNC